MGRVITIILMFCSVVGYGQKTTGWYRATDALFLPATIDPTSARKSVLAVEYDQLTEPTLFYWDVPTTAWKAFSFSGTTYTAGSGIDITGNVISAQNLIIGPYYDDAAAITAGLTTGDKYNLTKINPYQGKYLELKTID